MKETEIIQKDIGLTFDFLRYVIDNPQILDRIPDEAELIFLCNESPLKINASPKKSAMAENRILFNCHHTFEPVGQLSEEQY